ncbi:hypothetical protein JCM31826_14520 [Thermaurantimonas aggregans]|uniref:FecR protein domain-containing protein n=1 Tax=Thermaurantimonas aggregans TaxID=2173829 RepID=A0A401XLU1_9FLAO|nr:hypothetical protein [Thermaurantimonas aggregans]MCX8147780.1 DUF4366 domain-containing protein [Thermaurantimonas aggregans]GCD77970.1 hypothetical protein JCM31826_14520 [Thermaurantimonas aggregans]
MKRLVSFLAVLILVIAIGFGIYWYFYLRKPKEPVSLINLKTTLVCNSDAVEVLRSNKENWEPARNGDEIYWGDRIRIPAGTEAALVINPKSKIELIDECEVWLEQTNDGKGALYLIKGDVRYTLDADLAFSTGKIKYSGGEVLLQSNKAAVPYIETGITQKSGGESTLFSSYAGDHTLKNASGDYVIESGKAAIIPPTGDAPQIVDLPDPPQIKTPKNGEKIQKAILKKGFDVIWTPTFGAVKYRLEFLPTNQRTAVGISYYTNNTGMRIRNIEPNPYLARVYAEDIRGLKSKWSDGVEIDINNNYFRHLEKQATSQGIYVGFMPYRDVMIAGGFIRGYSPAEHDVVLFSRTDYWWIQPLLDDFNTPIDPDGYFEIYTNLGDALAVYVVKKGFKNFADRYPDGQLPPVDGVNIKAFKIVPRNTF